MRIQKISSSLILYSLLAICLCLLFSTHGHGSELTPMEDKVYLEKQLDCNLDYSYLQWEHSGTNDPFRSFYSAKLKKRRRAGFVMTLVISPSIIIAGIITLNTLPACESEDGYCGMFYGLGRLIVGLSLVAVGAITFSISLLVTNKTHGKYKKLKSLDKPKPKVSFSTTGTSLSIQF